MIWTAFECVITIQMDHHCPWLDGCVGHRNHRHFFLYMVFTVAGCLFVMLFGFEVRTCTKFETISSDQCSCSFASNTL